MGESDICFNKFTHHFKKISPFNTESIKRCYSYYSLLHINTFTNYNCSGGSMVLAIFRLC